MEVLHLRKSALPISKEKVMFLAEQLGTEHSRYHETLQVASRVRKLKKEKSKMDTARMVPVSPKVAPTPIKFVSVVESTERGMLEAYDKQIASLERQRVQMEDELKNVKDRLRKLLRKRPAFIKALDLTEKK